MDGKDLLGPGPQGAEAINGFTGEACREHRVLRRLDVTAVDM